MNWKQTLFWSFSAAAIFYYFLLFGVFVFVGNNHWFFWEEEVFHQVTECKEDELPPGRFRLNDRLPRASHHK